MVKIIELGVSSEISTHANPGKDGKDGEGGYGGKGGCQGLGIRAALHIETSDCDKEFFDVGKKTQWEIKSFLISSNKGPDGKKGFYIAIDRGSQTLEPGGNYL
ncbi:hypothetical protein CDAR_303401 [Caerostris darwini]|uniref:Uncharacterized protein n=1 Tax=Caerostris darwini TaxID=1538125 RepID=A0AAV4N0J9_9ARAC|nr:hypothetical protein CDAR_303401 [Caerostris darwini]